MPDRVIRIDASTPGGRVEDDRWTFLSAEQAANPPAKGAIVVPLAAWLDSRDAWLTRGEVGVILDPADDPRALAQDIATLPLVAIHYPKFTDGRGHSTAVLLRSRLGFKGELRAIGDVGHDQLFQLKRCGFDAFNLAPHRNPEAALPGLTVFTERYQASVDDPQPLFRKRLAAAAQR